MSTAAIPIQATLLVDPGQIGQTSQLFLTAAFNVPVNLRKTTVKPLPCLLAALLFSFSASDQEAAMTQTAANNIEARKDAARRRMQRIVEHVFAVVLPLDLYYGV
ncbi:MAG TPA: hypothetical protein PLY87_05865 [Planctomycetaceae bacterium]|nr:hypothetical protein [Planctomycetaceae bacterium]HQZ64579.1 hypothetical protein [Planctomycetaceae bacterium]